MEDWVNYITKNMTFISKIWRVVGLFFDFLFPRDARVRRLEEMGSSEISAALPAARPFENLPAELDRGRFFALFDYSNETVKQIVWEIKYRKNLVLAAKMGELLAGRVLEVVKASDTRPDARPNARAENFLFLPIPSSRRRRRWRGFNQTELIAQEVVKSLREKVDSPNSSFEILSAGFSYADVLAKIKETPPQSSLPERHERLTNLVGAFDLKDAAAAGLVRGKNIVIIDDVITTGATMREAVLVFLRAGAKNIYGFSVAH